MLGPICRFLKIGCTPDFGHSIALVECPLMADLCLMRSAPVDPQPSFGSSTPRCPHLGCFRQSRRAWALGIPGQACQVCGAIATCFPGRRQKPVVFGRPSASVSEAIAAIAHLNKRAIRMDYAVLAGRARMHVVVLARPLNNRDLVRERCHPKLNARSRAMPPLPHASSLAP
jgi:hypothetical protein